MNDLNALFSSVDGLKEDLMEYGTIAAGAIGANVVWNIASAKFIPADLNPMLRKYGVPAAAILLGIFGGRMVARYNRKLGLGATIGLVAAGLTQLAKTVVPNLPVSGLSGDEDYYGVAGFMGAPISIEDGMSGAPVAVEEFNGFEAALQ